VTRKNKSPKAIEENLGQDMEENSQELSAGKRLQ
jgi:hypothetical protein